MLLMFLALFASTSWIQVVNADTLAQNSRNTRALYDSYEVQRGSIIVSGSAIASSVPSNDVFAWQRVYTDAQMWGHVTGWINPALGSATGIEQAMNQALSGTASSQFLSRIDRIFTGQPPRGSNVVLTLDAAVQRAAYDALGDLQGAVIAIDPETGKVLAMVSSPDFDTNLLAAHDADAVNAYYDQLVADPADPLFDRTIGGDLNPPGSTFKLVVASAALASGDYTPESTLPNPASYQLPQSSNVVFNATRGAVRAGRDGHDRRRAAAELQHPVRGARRRTRRHRDPRRGREVRLQRVVRAAARLDPVELPPSPRRPADGTHRLRPGTGHRDAAADGDGVGRNRERRNGHEPTDGRPRDRPGPLGAADVRRQRVRPCTRRRPRRARWWR